MRRDFVATIVAGVASAGLALFAASRTWIVEVTLRAAPLPPVEVERSGGSLVPGLTASALVGLAGVGALLATRGRVRLGVSVLVAAAGLGVVGSAFFAFDRYGGAGAWPFVAMAAGLVLAGAGMTALGRSADWPAMGARYERPASSVSAEPTDSAGMWDAIDRGDDPTQRDS